MTFRVFKLVTNSVECRIASMATPNKLDFRREHFSRPDNPRLLAPSLDKWNDLPQNVKNNLDPDQARLTPVTDTERQVFLTHGSMLYFLTYPADAKNKLA